MAETFGTTFGCLLISFMIDLILYGMGLLLVLQYFRKCSKDAILVKTTVLGLIVFATTHIVGMCTWVYRTFITGFSRPELLNELPPSVSIEIMSFYIVSFIAQSFYISQIWKISHRNIWITSPIVVLALINIGAGTAQTVTTAQRGTASGIDDEINKIITIIETGAAALCDILVTIALCVLLRINRTGIKSTDSALDSLIILAINRGTVTSLASVVDLILYLTRPKSMFFMLVFNPSTQLYLLSVVGSLNYREGMRAGSRHRKKEWHNFNTTANDSYSLPLENIGPSVHSSRDGVHVVTPHFQA
ncbi:uncharacterized protein EV420DRAFT_1532767 [Desarmillaria tabescens]|uniref:DUF6534 domain-containing protein n=1 Tax=Armillaria tabescens TaxID=1929756 RepID=A0AA39TIY1_ARMTA|nr:uncharacterized protein EV420DRAFT_1532767 [Desarmillaria tabescens]KAK0460542.1 hypothetical protein EV420DRAFT_1532767 [Desarmillaria tabescens]